MEDIFDAFLTFLDAIETFLPCRFGCRFPSVPGHEHGRWSSGQAVGWPVTVSWATKNMISVHLSFHENLVNADEMDGKWKVETGAFFFQGRFLNLIRFCSKIYFCPWSMFSGS